jgi:hypothetical protein
MRATFSPYAFSVRALTQDPLPAEAVIDVPENVQLKVCAGAVAVVSGWVGPRL